MKQWKTLIEECVFLSEGDNRQDDQHMHSWRALLPLNTVFQGQSKVGTATIYCLLLLRTHVTCVPFSSVKPASGVWGSLSGTIGRVSHSLISHTKGGRSTREVEGQQRLASLPYEQSCLNRVADNTFIIIYLLHPNTICCLYEKGEGQQEEGSVESYNWLPELHASLTKLLVYEYRVHCEEGLDIATWTLQSSTGGRTLKRWFDQIHLAHVCFYRTAWS